MREIIKTKVKYDFEDGIDFVIVKKDDDKSLDYIVTMDMEKSPK